MAIFLQVSHLLDCRLERLLDTSDESSGDEDDRIIMFPITKDAAEDGHEEEMEAEEPDQDHTDAAVDNNPSTPGNDYASLQQQSPPQVNAVEFLGAQVEVHGLPSPVVSDGGSLSVNVGRDINGIKVRMQSGSSVINFKIDDIAVEDKWIKVTGDESSQLISKGFSVSLMEGITTLQCE